MRKLAVLISLVTAAGLMLIAAAALADRGNGGGSNKFRADLNGYNEVVGGPGPSSTGSVSTTGHGTFRARLRHNPERLEFTLTYADLEGGAVTEAHPHFAQRHVGASIFGHFCGGPKPPCPPSGTVTGTWTAADVTGPTAQGVAPGEFDEFVRALRAGAVYVNVHTTNYPEGEIRGQVGRRHGD
jgi:CHRD domain